MDIFKKTLSVTCLTLGFLQTAQGVHYEDVSESDYFGDLPIVLSATRLQQPISDAPVAITVIDREMIEASGARHIFELFRLVPGVQVGSASGHVHTVTYHGMSDQYSGRMQILIDGRSVYSPAIGGVEWTELTLSIEEIERIEFIRGPNAATYGANAFLGTISIITRPPSTESGYNITLKTGNAGTKDALMRYSGKTENADYRLTLAYMSDDGFEDQNDSSIVRRVNFSANYHPTLNDHIDIRLGFSNGPRQVGNETSAFYQPGTIHRERRFQQINWNHIVSADNEYTFQFYHNYDAIDETHRSLALEPFKDDYKISRLDFEFFNLRKTQGGDQFVWGMSVRKDKLRSPVLFEQNDSISTELYRLFSHYEWNITSKLLLNAGVMLEKNDLTDSDFSPRLALNYALTPNHTIRASVSRALRTPILFEEKGHLEVNMLPIPAPVNFPGGSYLIYSSKGNLKPESMISREIGYIGQFPNANVKLDVKAYYDTIDDLIHFSPGVSPNPATPPPAVWDNFFSTTIQGMEFSINWQPSRKSRLIFNYAYAEIDSDAESMERSTPQHTLSMLGIYDITPKLKASANFYYLDEMEWLDLGSTISDHSQLDLRLGYDFTLAKTDVLLALTLQNVLGEHKDFQNGNKVDTTAYASLSVSFH